MIGSAAFALERAPKGLTHGLFDLLSVRWKIKGREQRGLVGFGGGQLGRGGAG